MLGQPMCDLSEQGNHERETQHQQCDRHYPLLALEEAEIAKVNEAQAKTNGTDEFVFERPLSYESGNRCNEGYQQ